MSSEDIIDALALTAKLMELHDENSFKTKAIANAAFRLSKLRYNFEGRTKEEIAALEGVGKSIGDKIWVMMETGHLPELKGLLEKTPTGIIELLHIKGLGPKKVRQLWHELQIESPGELLYACNENRLVTLKGFGDKTQAQVKHALEFNETNRNKFHYAALVPYVQTWLNSLLEKNIPVVVTGQMARTMEVIDEVSLLSVNGISITVPEGFPCKVSIAYTEPAQFGREQLALSASQEHLEQIKFDTLPTGNYPNEQSVYTQLGLPFITAELREGMGEVALAKNNALPHLIQLSDLKGTLHNHTTWSDGVHSLAEMAQQCLDMGLTYFGVCDHSKSAFYANGLSEERVMAQHQEIDTLNATYSGFKILKGIECDILGDGQLDYHDDLLKSFDFVVASIHANLRMNEEKATARLIKAIENPYTTILGHPTGRLLLARTGYPINHVKIIDACAANGVSIELNAHPYRLDIDWRWIPYCMERGVFISINPDAHHKDGLKDMQWGIVAARKGRLTKEACLNALGLDEILQKF